MIFLTFPLRLFFQRQVDPEENNHIEQRFISLLKGKKGKGVKEPVVCYMHMGIFANIKLFLFQMCRFLAYRFNWKIS
jgi:hypothetical protein